MIDGLDLMKGNFIQLRKHGAFYVIVEIKENTAMVAKSKPQNKSEQELIEVPYSDMKPIKITNALLKRIGITQVRRNFFSHIKWKTFCIWKCEKEYIILNIKDGEAVTETRLEGLHHMQNYIWINFKLQMKDK